MDRRHFLQNVLAGSTVLGRPHRRKSNLRSHRLKGRAPASLLRCGPTRLAALGVSHICSALPSRSFDENWSVEGLTKLRERMRALASSIDMVPLPLSSTPIGRAENPNIMMGKSPNATGRSTESAK